MVNEMEIFSLLLLSRWKGNLARSMRETEKQVNNYYATESCFASLVRLKKIILETEDLTDVKLINNR